MQSHQRIAAHYRPQPAARTAVTPRRAARPDGPAARVAIGVALLALTAALVIALGGCTATQDEAGSSAATGDALYFDSPEQAVEVAAKLIRAEDWATLGRYYDLRGSGIDPAAARRRSFYMNDQSPGGSAHPAGFRRYRQPFAPAFKYHSVTDTTSRDGVAMVTVMVEIDQGGGPPQRGLDTFPMRRSDRGWQFLPRLDADGSGGGGGPVPGGEHGGP